ncbi:hypothetical protein PVAP13_2KG426500 [Panicum virgatum]|uniref:Uncharacterized protein n=1 Tax=Panicum virgatum TaxID=38727 RepID=A0A8T0W4L5_PANVG|nr:hypothetical protein PVAP13_2KG426500 [Panicum virgatum]
MWSVDVSRETRTCYAAIPKLRPKFSIVPSNRPHARNHLSLPTLPPHMLQGRRTAGRSCGDPHGNKLERQRAATCENNNSADPSQASISSAAVGKMASSPSGSDDDKARVARSIGGLPDPLIRGTRSTHRRDQIRMDAV